jgi:hypothetical protein
VAQGPERGKVLRRNIPAGEVCLSQLLADFQGSVADPVPRCYATAAEAVIAWQ